MLVSTSSDPPSQSELVAFEEGVANEFLAARIRAPIHLSGGNEKQLIEIFRDVRPDDWVFSTWRSHYHALLAGIPPEWIQAEIMAGRSMFLCHQERRFLSSAIAGGILPIALGVALGVKLAGTHERVWCFVGDMTARMGIYHESLQYAKGHDLRMTFVVEDNGLSTNTPTTEVWGLKVGTAVQTRDYRYERKWPHTGVGQFVSFG